MLLNRTMSRRGFLGVGAAAVSTVALPFPARAWASALVDPYSGSLPLVFPVATGSYTAPVADNWHASREGKSYPWNHRDGLSVRGHDGVDVYPSSPTLPPIYAPLTSTVAAVCRRSANTLDGIVTYRASSVAPPPWDYSQAVDDTAQLPLYGNFVWLYSTDSRSRGYFVFLCHLQNDATLAALAVDQPVTTTQVGLMGDTGNAAGTPQLHVEIHYPRGSSYACTHCSPRKTITSIDPEASLVNAAPRPLQ